MLKFILALHLVAAIFIIGPLVASATTAVRGIRSADSAAVATSARLVRIYSFASLLVAALGMGLVQDKWHIKFSDPWLIISMVLWAVAVALGLFVLVPALEDAGAKLAAGETVESFKGRVAAVGGVIGILFIVVVFLMVYGPKR